MANISSEEFLGGGSAKFVGNEQRIQRQEAETNEPSFFNNLFESISTRVDRTGDILERKDSSIAEKGLQIFGQGTGAAADVFEQTVEQVPGVKQVLGAAGATINFLASSAPIKAIGEKIGGQDSVVELTRLYDTDQNFKDSVVAVAKMVRLGGDVQMAVMQLD